MPTQTTPLPPDDAVSPPRPRTHLGVPPRSGYIFVFAHRETLGSQFRFIPGYWQT